MFWRWLKSTDELQRETYGYGNMFEKIMVDPDTKVEVNARQYYLMWNLLAAFIELAELSLEFSWKPWATDKPFMNSERMRDEVIDVNHFLGNILTIAGITDADYEEAYRIKQKINRQRAESGTYSARKGGLGEGSDARGT